MTIQYNKISVGAEPTNPQIYDWWISQSSTQYVVKIYCNSSWQTYLTDGTYIVEDLADNHYINTIVSETQPDDIIKFGWLWVKESTKQIKIFLGVYVLLFTWT
jgi:cephalosporin hydroxylase